MRAKAQKTKVKTATPDEICKSYRPIPSSKRIVTISERAMTPEQELNVARAVYTVLTTHYSGHPWHVMCEGGLIRIKHMQLSADRGMTLGVDDLTPEGAEIMRAGGELLERFNVSRETYNRDKIRELPRKFNGEREHDAS